MAMRRQVSALRATVYARFSSELQRQASIHDQIEVCRRYIERQGWKLVDTYEDAALSGGSRFRPGFQKLLADVDRGIFDIVVVEALDRLGRKLADVAEFHDRVIFAGLKLYTVNYGEITPMQIGMLGTMAQMFLSDLRDKTRRGQLGRARLGKIPGGLAYGYQLGKPEAAAAKDIEPGDRRIDEAEAEVVRRIFREFADGHSPRQIAARLNREGIPGPGGRPWGDTSVRGQVYRGTGILNNSLYTGRLDWNRCSYFKDPRTGKRVARPNPPEEWESVEIPHLRIIDDDLWQRAKARQEVVRIEMRRDETGNALNRTHRRRFLLSGLLVCGCCGGAYTIVGTDRYGCARRRSKGTCDNRKVVTRQEIENRVLTGLKDRLLAPELVKAFVSEFEAELRRSAANAGLERKHALKQLASIEQKIGAIVRAIEDGAYNSTLRERLTALEAEKMSIEAHVARMGEPATVQLHPNAPDLYRRMVDNLAEALSASEALAEAGEIVRQLIERIVLEPQDNGAMRVVLYGDHAVLMSSADDGHRKTNDPGRNGSGSLLSVVAGEGFEPPTLGL
jgi:site-specific DNA recombinase